MGLTRDQILGVRDLHLTEAHVPEWAVDGDDTVYLRPLDAGDRARYIAAMSGDELPENYAEQLVARCLVDAEGVRLFSDEEIPLLSRKSFGPIRALRDQCMKLNGMTPKVVEEIAGNSEPTPSGDSSSA